MSAVVDDLRARSALPERLGGAERHRDWRVAPRNARALLNVYLSVFRARKRDLQGGKGFVAAAAAAGDRMKDKPPAGSYEVVEAASKAADRQLALPADMLEGVTSV